MGRQVLASTLGAAFLLPMAACAAGKALGHWTLGREALCVLHPQPRVPPKKLQYAQRLAPKEPVDTKRPLTWPAKISTWLFHEMGVLSVGVLIIFALLFGVHMRLRHFLNTPM